MKETELKIKFYGEHILRKKAKQVGKVDDSHRRFLSAMAQLMYSSAGIGLAAPQAGLSEAMIVVDIGTGLYKLINPRIMKSDGIQSTEEGCLSLPGICLKVKRAKRVTVSALDDTGKAVAINAEGLLACVMQHEIDHLHGKLIIDHAGLLDKVKIKGKIKALLKAVKNEKLPESEKQSCELQL